MSDKINSVDSFIKLVAEMRATQIRYFKSRRSGDGGAKDLTRSKQLERMVDDWLVSRKREESQLELIKGQKVN